MPRSPGAAIVLLGVAASCCAHAPPTREVSSADLHAEVDRHSCAYWEPEVREYGVLFLDDRCPYSSTGTPLAHAVEAAVAEASPLTFLATAGEHFYAATAQQQPPTPPAADALARATFWRDPLLVPAILDRALAHLPAHRLRCTDCVAAPRPSPRTVSWDSFFPYLQAFLWPTQFEPGGEVVVYVCAGNNGAAALPPDETLIHAAKLAALAFIADAAARTQVRAAAEGETSVPAVAARLEDLLRTPASRARACAAIARTRWFTGLTVDPC